MWFGNELTWTLVFDLGQNPKPMFMEYLITGRGVRGVLPNNQGMNTKHVKIKVIGRNKTKEKEPTKDREGAKQKKKKKKKHTYKEL